MAMPRAFLSFDFEHDETTRNLFAGQAKRDSPTPFAVEDWSSRASLPQAQWERLIAQKIAKCHMLIVLVGRHMGSATGVVKEIEMAKAANVPYFGVYVDGAGRLSTLPTGLPRSSCVAWTWQDVAKMVDQCMTRGKNARSSFFSR